MITTKEVKQAIDALASMTTVASITPETVAAILEKLRQLSDEEAVFVKQIAEEYIQKIKDEGEAYQTQIDSLSESKADKTTVIEQGQKLSELSNITGLVISFEKIVEIQPYEYIDLTNEMAIDNGIAHIEISCNKSITSNSFVVMVRDADDKRYLQSQIIKDENQWDGALHIIDYNINPSKPVKISLYCGGQTIKDSVTIKVKYKFGENSILDRLASIEPTLSNVISKAEDSYNYISTFTRNAKANAYIKEMYIEIGEGSGYTRNSLFNVQIIANFSNAGKYYWAVIIKDSNGASLAYNQVTSTVSLSKSPLPSIVKLEEYNSSKVSGYAVIDWFKYTDGDNFTVGLNNNNCFDFVYSPIIKALYDNIELLNTTKKEIVNHFGFIYPYNKCVKEAYFQNFPENRIADCVMWITCPPIHATNTQIYIMIPGETGYLYYNQSREKDFEKVFELTGTGIFEGAKAYFVIDWDAVKKYTVGTPHIKFEKANNNIVLCPIINQLFDEKINDVDKHEYFDAKHLRPNLIKSVFMKQHNTPNLEVGTHIHNGVESYMWIYGKDKFDVQSDNPIYNPFEESPYQKTAPSMMTRDMWITHNPSVGNYDFSSLNDMIKVCIDNHTRLVLQIGVLDYIGMRGSYKEKDGVKYYSSMPQYVLDKIYTEGDAVFSTSYKAMCANQANDYLYEQYALYLSALKQFLLGNNYKGIQYYNVIGLIECRHRGFWGEGINQLNIDEAYYENLVDTEKLDRWYDLYLNTFNDKQILAGGQILHQLIVTKNEKYKVLLQKHCYNVFSKSNSYGKIGIFRDSWQDVSNPIYEPNKEHYVVDKDGKKIGLNDWLKTIYSNTFIGGEFADVNGVDSPYSTLYHDFKLMKTTSLSPCNYTTIGSGQGIFGATQFGIDCMSAIGYRIVLSNTIISNNVLSYYLTNIGFDVCREKWWKHRVVIERSGERVITFDMADLTLIGISNKPMNFDPYHYGKKNTVDLSVVDAQEDDVVKLIIEDSANIQHPMVLSNWGRNEDGSYTLAIYNNNAWKVKN